MPVSFISLFNLLHDALNKEQLQSTSAINPATTKNSLGKTSIPTLDVSTCKTKANVLLYTFSALQNILALQTKNRVLSVSVIDRVLSP